MYLQCDLKLCTILVEPIDIISATIGKGVRKLVGVFKLMFKICNQEYSAIFFLMQDNSQVYSGLW